MSDTLYGWASGTVSVGDRTRVWGLSSVVGHTDVGLEFLPVSPDPHPTLSSYTLDAFPGLKTVKVYPEGEVESRTQRFTITGRVLSKS